MLSFGPIHSPHYIVEGLKVHFKSSTHFIARSRGKVCFVNNLSYFVIEG